MSESPMDLVCVVCGRDYGNHVGDYCHPLAARSVPPSMFTPAPDPRDAEIAALRSRVEKLEAVERAARDGRVAQEDMDRCQKIGPALGFLEARERRCAAMTALDAALAAVEVRNG